MNWALKIEWHKHKLTSIGGGVTRSLSAIHTCNIHLGKSMHNGITKHHQIEYMKNKKKNEQTLVRKN